MPWQLTTCRQHHELRLWTSVADIHIGLAESVQDACDTSKGARIERKARSGAAPKEESHDRKP